MALFLSTFENKVDNKGRVSVPSQFRSMMYGKDFSGIVIYQSSINNAHRFKWCIYQKFNYASPSQDKRNYR